MPLTAADGDHLLAVYAEVLAAAFGHQEIREGLRFCPDALSVLFRGRSTESLVAKRSLAVLKAVRSLEEALDGAPASCRVEKRVGKRPLCRRPRW